jgi:hypothetical protein
MVDLTTLFTGLATAISGTVPWIPIGVLALLLLCIGLAFSGLPAALSGGIAFAGIAGLVAFGQLPGGALALVEILLALAGGYVFIKVLGK